MQYDLIFEGGGAKGSVFVGAIQEFEERGNTARRFVGTSAGAITATLMAAGYRSSEMLGAVNEKLPDGTPRFSTFMDIPDSFDKRDIQNSLTYKIFEKVDLPWIPGMVEGMIDDRIFEQLIKIDAYREIFSFIERGGLYAGDRFLEWMREKLDANGRNFGNTTLFGFYSATGNDLSLVASDTKGQEMLVLNHRTAPDCPVTLAVRMSMSIPFVWQEVIWRPEWGLYRGKDISGHTIVDGGVLSNFPIYLLTSRDDEVAALMGDTDPDAVPNLGLLIDETLPVEGSGNAEDEEETDSLAGGLVENARRLKTVKRIMRLVNTMTNAHDRLAIEAHEKEVCRLPAKGYGTTEFDMSDSRLQALIMAGKKAMKEYFDRQV
ncbi:MAG: patatin-like phospholipase family protein [Nitrospirota bacterium]